MQKHLNSIDFLGTASTLVGTRTQQLPEPKIKPLQCETFLQQVAAAKPKNRLNGEVDL
jgi:hypothetical protein